MDRLMEKYPGAVRDTSVHGNGPAVYYRIPGALGSVGFISAIHGRFCDSCNRIRLTAKGELKPCLCYEESIDVKNMLRNAADETECGREYKNMEAVIADRAEKAICEAIMKKPQMHCFEEYERVTERRQMVQIGG